MSKKKEWNNKAAVKELKVSDAEGVGDASRPVLERHDRVIALSSETFAGTAAPAAREGCVALRDVAQAA